MKRRSYMVGLAAGSTIGGGCSQLDTALDSENEYIDEHRWNEDDELVLAFQEDHDTDGYAILHEHHSSIDDAIISGESPDFAGPLLLDLIGEIRDEDYPSFNFDAKLYEGEFGPLLSLADEELGSYSFEVSEDKIPDTVISG